MRQVIELDNKLVQELKALTGEPSAIRALLHAVKEYLALRKREKVIQMFRSGRLKLKYTNEEIEAFDKTT